MNKFGVAALIFGCSCYLAAADLTRNGQADSEIILENATNSRQLQYAADELANWVGKISNCTIPIKQNSADPTLTKVILGTPISSLKIADFVRNNAEDYAKLKDNDGFIIREIDNNIYIVGSKSKGVLNGVYRFLERNSDIIFVREMAGETGFGTIYSTNPNFKNQITNLVDVPRLTTRYWTSAGGSNYTWQARLLNTATRSFDEMSYNIDHYKYFSKVFDTSSFSANLPLSLIDDAFDEHPDFFPLLNGKRSNEHDHQLCFMNPAMIEYFCQKAEQALREYPNTVNSITVGLGDNWSVCECDLCTKPITLPNGKTVAPTDKNFRSTQYMLFTNALSDYLTQKLPHLQPIGGSAYLFTAEAAAVPSRGKGVFYCPYIKNHKKPVFDDETNHVWHDKAERFKAAGMPVSGLYEYYLCSTTPEFYHAISEVAQQDIKYYLPHLKSMYLDVVYNDGPNSGEKVYDISAIEFYVLSRLMWNPDIDVKAARKEFCRRAYREAGDIMNEYYATLAENYNHDPAGCFWNDDPVSAARHYIVDKNLASFVREKLAAALAAAQHPGSKELISRHRARMLALIDTAEKLPPRVTLAVPGTTQKITSFDPNSPQWQQAAVIAPFTQISDATRPASRHSVVKMQHDRKNLYILFDLDNPTYSTKVAEYQAAGNPQLENFDWVNCIEMFIDGGLKTSGNYYHLAFMFNGQTHSGIGPTPMSNPVKWSAQLTPKANGIRALITLPLAEIGVNISQGNKLGGMFIVNGGAWNGGQWHSPTGFQNILLQMD